MVYPRIDGADEANARRIVACVNSCAEFSTEDLENATTDKRHRALIIADLTIANKRCDELLAALKLWKIASDNSEESELDDMACQCIPMPLFCDADEAMEAAISKAEQS